MKNDAVKNEPGVILLAEDNPGHAEIVRRNFSGSRTATRLMHVEDGRAALDYLYRRDGYSDPSLSPRPDIILLDLRMPKVDGLEVLRTIKSEPGLARIPVVVLTTSDSEKDVALAYEYHANSYMVKPVDFPQFTAMMESLINYWLVWNKNPISTGAPS